MSEQPIHQELLNRVTSLTAELDEARKEIEDLKAQLAACPYFPKGGFGAEDLQFAMAESKIDILEAFEYYLSQSSPACTMLDNAINEFPEIGPVIEYLISSVLTDIDTTWTRKKLIQFAIEVLQSDLDGAVDAKRATI